MTETDFDRFWNAYPPRKGDRGKTPAKTLFDKIVKAGMVPEDIIRAAENFSIAEKDNHNTPFIMQAQRWLRNKRWTDYEFVPTVHVNTSDLSTTVFIREDSPQWRSWQKIKKTPCVNFGWWFPSEWPPGVSS